MKNILIAITLILATNAYSEVGKQHNSSNKNEHSHHCTSLESGERAKCMDYVRSKCGEGSDGEHTAKCVQEYIPPTVKCKNIKNSEGKHKCVELTHKCDKISGNQWKKCNKITDKCFNKSGAEHQKKCFEFEAGKIEEYSNKCGSSNSEEKIKCIVHERNKFELSKCSKKGDVIVCPDGEYVKKDKSFFEGFINVISSNRKEGKDIEESTGEDSESSNSSQR